MSTLYYYYIYYIIIIWVLVDGIGRVKWKCTRIESPGIHRRPSQWKRGFSIRRKKRGTGNLKRKGKLFQNIKKKNLDPYFTRLGCAHTASIERYYKMSPSLHFPRHRFKYPLLCLFFSYGDRSPPCPFPHFVRGGRKIRFHFLNARNEEGDSK